MTVQLNLQCLRPGQIECRNGYIQAITSPPVVSAVRYSSGTQDRLFVMADGGFYLFEP